MDQLKVCFVGIGSIAKRHIRNLRSICNDRGISLTIDALRRNLKQVDGVDRIYTSVAELSIDYDVIFITNPTDLHLETLKVLQEHVFMKVSYKEHSFCEICINAKSPPQALT